jgi:hypothetical protein
MFQAMKQANAYSQFLELLARRGNWLMVPRPLLCVVPPRQALLIIHALNTGRRNADRESWIPYSDVKLWDPATGTSVRSLRAHTAVVWTIQFSPDGKKVATSDAGGTVKLWR